MRIGKQDQNFTSISTSDAHSITIRGQDLCDDLIGKIDFTDYFWLLVLGERPSATQRRMMDAARLLPVLGAGMFVLPLLWKSGEGTRTVVVMFYIFLCWSALIGLGWIVSRRLSGPDAKGGSDLTDDADEQVRVSREG